ncbi:MAG: YdcF family protein [Cyclobacteriaceae bacterium]
MFFVISKVLNFVTAPLTWIVAGFLVGVFKKKPWMIHISLVVLIVLSNPLLSRIALEKWQYPPVDKANLQLFDVAIVLTGMTKTNMSQADQLHFSDGADRMTEAIDLYKIGNVRKILISGGSGTLLYDEIESNKLKEFAITCGVKSNDVIVEAESRNTYENAFYSKKALEQRDYLDRELLLITSAFHMPRAMRCFDKQGLSITPFPVDYRSSKMSLDPALLVPSARALDNWTLLFNEWIGILAYRLVGYA